MRSSTGEHFVALDHIRALAVFLVFTWHFIHSGSYIPTEYVPPLPAFPLALLEEGHTGVALFMTLSGYLFAKLLGDRALLLIPFLWNRFVRLVPLLAVVLVVAGLQHAIWLGKSSVEYLKLIAWGLVKPTLPNGGWSITVEFHFYLLLPLLLWIARRWAAGLFALLGATIALRTGLYAGSADLQGAAYGTLVGRIDQFVLGIALFRYRALVASAHAFVAAAALAFLLFWWSFDTMGGFSGTVMSPIWIILPTIEGAAYATFIAYYDSSFRHSSRELSGFVARIGSYSYSIYLWHFFVVGRAARVVNEHIVPLSNFGVACLWALACFGLMVPVGYLSWRIIEEPFLRLRKSYLGDLMEAK